MTKVVSSEFCFLFFLSAYFFLLGIFWSLDISDMLFLSLLFLDLNEDLNSISVSYFFPFTFFHYIHMIFIIIMILMWKNLMDVDFLFYSSSFNYTFTSFYLLGNILDISWFSLIWFMLVFLKIFN